MNGIGLCQPSPCTGLKPAAVTLSARCFAVHASCPSAITLCQSRGHPQHATAQLQQYGGSRKASKRSMAWLATCCTPRVKAREMGGSKCWGSICTCVSVVTLRVGLVSMPLLSVPCRGASRDPAVAYSTGVRAVAAFQQRVRTQKYSKSQVMGPVSIHQALIRRKP